MKITVCELPNDFAVFEEAWKRLASHARKEESEVVLLPEMPFFPWLAQNNEFDASQWEQAVENHKKWISHLDVLAPAIVVSTWPVTGGGIRNNLGYIWEPGTGIQDVHAKYYLPDEDGFWEASWYQRGDGRFSVINTSKGKFGFLICTELWFTSTPGSMESRVSTSWYVPGQPPSPRQRNGSPEARLQRLSQAPIVFPQI
jgi:N-carbamoylputrescine amidase